MTRYRPHMTGGQQLDALLAGLDSAQVKSLLRHPAWWQRCDCGRYGIPPYGIDLTVIDHDAAHGRRLCQPTREWLPR